MTKFEEEKNI